MKHQNYHLQSSPDLIEELIGQVGALQCTKVLDLGSGDGKVLEALTRAGYEAYGIEHDQEQVDRTVARFSNLGLPQPQILTADYKELRHLKFADGTTLKDIDFFYCYSYDIEHAHQVFVNVLTGHGARIGAHAWITSMRYSRKTNRAGFQRVSWWNNIVRKTEEKRVDLLVRTWPLKYENQQGIAISYRVM